MVEYFLDLREACLGDAGLEILATALAGHVRDEVTPHNYQLVAGPKQGNALLVAAVAHKLGLAPVLLKEQPQFNRLIEGLYPREARALLVDDITSDGELLRNCAQLSRAHGIDVDKAFVLIHRREGDAERVLRDVGVTLYAHRKIDDDALAELDRRFRSANRLRG